MKIEVTNASVVNEMGVVAAVEMMDGVTVKVDVRQPLGWNDWLDLSDAVRKVMLMMEIH